TRCCAKTRSVHARPATTSICSHPRNPPMKPRPKKNRKTNPTKTTPSLRNQILADFATLRIPVTADQLDAALAEAEKAGWSHLDFLHRLLTDQAGLRRERSLQRRIHDAGLGDLKPLREFHGNLN